MFNILDLVNPGNSGGNPGVIAAIISGIVAFFTAIGLFFKKIFSKKNKK